MRRVAGLPTVYWWLWIGYLLSSLGTFVFPFLALYLSSRGIDARQTGLVLSLLRVDRRRARWTDLARAVRGRRDHHGAVRGARRLPRTGIAAQPGRRSGRPGLEHARRRSTVPRLPRDALRLHDGVLAVPVRPSP